MLVVSRNSEVRRTWFVSTESFNRQAVKSPLLAAGERRLVSSDAFVVGRVVLVTIIATCS